MEEIKQMPLMAGTGVVGIHNDWEHVVYQKHDTYPDYEEMCRVKSIFWDDESVVAQIYPKKLDNTLPYSIHLWRHKYVSPKAEKALRVRVKDAYKRARKFSENNEYMEIMVMDDLGDRVLIFCGEEWISQEKVMEIKQHYWGDKTIAQFFIAPKVDLNPEKIMILFAVDEEKFDLPDYD